MLSYKYLFRFGGMESITVQNDIKIFMECSKRGEFNCNILLSRGFNLYKSIEEISTRTGEEISKALLSIATNRYNIRLRKKNIQGAIIHGTKVGVCWTCNCCKYDASVTSRYCDKLIYSKLHTLDNKMIHLVTNSKFNKYIEYINNFIQKALDNMYSGNLQSSLEYNSKQYIISSKLNQNELIELQLQILDYAQNHRNTWNWVQIYNIMK